MSIKINFEHQTKFLTSKLILNINILRTNINFEHHNKLWTASNKVGHSDLKYNFFLYNLQTQAILGKDPAAKGGLFSIFRSDVFKRKLLFEKVLKSLANEPKKFAPKFDFEIPGEKFAGNSNNPSSFQYVGKLIGPIHGYRGYNIYDIYIGTSYICC